MEEVPLAQPPLPVIEDHDAFAVEHEEVLLHGLGVVAAVGLPRLHDLHVHPGVRPRRVLVLEVDASSRGAGG